MRMLGIETATRTGGVAVVSDQGVIAEYTLNIEVTHSERLMSTVDRVLSDTGIGLQDLDGIAVSTGPGSFTGLRIGIATVQGIALTTGRPVVAVPTLQALAWNLSSSTLPVCPVLDAKKQQVYTALYRMQGGVIETVLPETVLSLGELRPHIAARTVFTGEGALSFRREIEALFGGNAVFASLAASVPSAASVAELGLARLTAGMLAAIDGLAPVYIRRPEAEVAWEKRHGSR